MERSTSWETDGRSATEDIPNRFRNLKASYGDCSLQPSVHNLGSMNHIHTPEMYLP